MISVVIPSRTDEYIGTLLDSMERSQPGSVNGRVVVVDSGLSPGVKSRWRDSVVFVPAKLPFIFAQAINQGVGVLGKDDDILVLNDDTEIVTPHWVTCIEAFLAQHHETQVLDKPMGVISLRIEGGVGNQEQTVSVGPLDYVVTDKTVCFVAALIPRGIWDKVGLLDTRFVGYGFDDDDYCRRARDAGFSCGVTGAATVKHGKEGLPHSGTFAKVFGTVEWSRRYELNARIFASKWKVTEIKERKCLNLGCGDKPRKTEGPDTWINLDYQEAPGVDVVRDIRRGLPFVDGTFDHVLADNILEHFASEDLIFVINEIDRVLKVGGTAEFIVPHAGSQGSVQDPTHKSLFVPRSCLYWNQVQTPYGGKFVGITANLVPVSNPDVYGDKNTEAFIRFNLKKEPVKK